MTARLLTAAAVGVLAGIIAFGALIATRAASLDDAAAAGPRVSADATAPTGAVSDAPFEVWGRNDDGSAVRWDPCTPIPWVLDDSVAPMGARDLVTEALRRIAAATGLEFRFDGTVREQPSTERSLVVDGPDGRAWAPVLVTWVPPDSTDLPLGQGELGVTVPVAVRDGGPRVFVTGQVLFNSERPLLPSFDDRHASWGAVVLHELGHLVGLDHVDAPEQLMHPTPGFGPVRFGEGDLAGLRAVGAAGGCVEQPAPRELQVAFD